MEILLIALSLGAILSALVSGAEDGVDWTR